MNNNMLGTIIDVILIGNLFWLLYRVHLLDKKVAIIKKVNEMLSNAILEQSYIDQAILKSVDDELLNKIDTCYKDIKLSNIEKNSNSKHNFEVGLN